jgi:hypothetical protein
MKNINEELYFDVDLIIIDFEDIMINDVDDYDLLLDIEILLKRLHNQYSLWYQM